MRGDLLMALSSHDVDAMGSHQAGADGKKEMFDVLTKDGELTGRAKWRDEVHRDGQQLRARPLPISWLAPSRLRSLISCWAALLTKLLLLG